MSGATAVSRIIMKPAPPALLLMMLCPAACLHTGQRAVRWASARAEAGAARLGGDVLAVLVEYVRDGWLVDVLML
jgi:hypothetical protein